LDYENIILQQENKRLNRLLTHYSGRHLLQLGEHTLLSLTVSPIVHKIRISNTSLSVNIASFPHIVLQSTYMQLPFASESIDLVLLPHTLERNKDAKRVLSESWRVLAPNGHLILLGINPFSLWGLYRLFTFTKKPVWDGCFYTIQTLCQWIHCLGGEICHTESFLFRPPLTSRMGPWLFDKLFFLEKISPWLVPYLGGIYLIIAQKHVRRPSKLGFAWHFPPLLTNKALAPNVREVHYE